jgi:hypothetical protein
MSIASSNSLQVLRSLTAWMHPLLRTTVHSATTAAQCDGFHSCGHTRLHCGTARRLWTNSASASVGIGCCGRARIGSYSIPYLDRGTSSVGCISYTTSILRKPSDHCVPLDSVRRIASHRIPSRRIASHTDRQRRPSPRTCEALHCTAEDTGSASAQRHSGRCTEGGWEWAWEGEWEGDGRRGDGGRDGREDEGRGRELEGEVGTSRPSRSSCPLFL